MEEHELSVGEHLSGKVEFVLTEPPCSVRSDPKNDHAEYDLSDYSDMNDMNKVFGAFTNPRAHGYMLRSALKFAFGYKALAS